MVNLNSPFTKIARGEMDPARCCVGPILSGKHNLNKKGIILNRERVNECNEKCAVKQVFSKHEYKYFMLPANQIQLKTIKGCS